MSNPNVNLPRRTRGDLVAAARAGVRREDFDDYAAKRIKEVEKEKRHPLTVPTESARGGNHRVEIDVDHFTVLQTLSTLAVRWHERLETSGLPATQPAEWRIFADAANAFLALEHHVGMWKPGEASALLELLSMRDDLSPDG